MEERFFPETVSWMETGQMIFRQWLACTEVIRREIMVDNPEVIDAVYRFIDEPVSQELATVFFNTVGVEKKLRPYEQLRKYLEGPSIPEDRIGMSLRSPSSDMTELEKFLVAQKYAFARDVKLLSLAAELSKLGQIKVVDEGIIKLHSGVILKADSSAAEMLDPNKWEKRRQIRDRVYQVRVNGKDYILKEKKTSRHVSLREEPWETIAVEKEYETAKKFSQQGLVTVDNVRLSWERPIGYAKFPDGFGFVLFEKEEGLLDAEEAKESLVQELERINPKMVDDEVDRNIRELFKTEGNLRNWVIAALGYYNIDNEDRLYRVVVEGSKVILEHVGFDFEYFLQPKRPWEGVKWYKDNDQNVYQYIKVFRPLVR